MLYVVWWCLTEKIQLLPNTNQLFRCRSNCLKKINEKETLILRGECDQAGNAKGVKFTWSILSHDVSTDKWNDVTPSTLRSGRQGTSSGESWGTLWLSLFYYSIYKRYFIIFRSCYAEHSSQATRRKELVEIKRAENTLQGELVAKQTQRKIRNL